MTKKDDQVLVSICCTTYNQEAYIKQTLDSFLMQKTNFKYEIIIHDDASTDNTANIIREYEEKYPDIIKPIYQKENQYSKKVKILPIVFGRATGKYIALCEGDDYWCSEHKLQKQFDFMESNQNCSLITTGAKLFNDSTGKFSKKKQPYKGSRFYSIEEIIIGDGDLFVTNSMFFKTELVQNLPHFYWIAPVGDYPITIHLALNGDVYFLKDVMSIYRVNAKGSWTVRMNQGNMIEKKKKLYNELKIMHEEINKETKNKYIESIKYYLLKKELEIFLLTKEKIKDKKYHLLYKKGTIKQRIKFFIKIHFNFIFYIKKQLFK